ncbi:hypothetical protein [Spiroplasma sp. AdecLV25b]|uniref:hypothetical protein n=1 Tax=Spiroplasma sp. AdecLV25b TaxID=3027162 RepID=UPI0027DF3F11|nr:hypothetical protein [Spiroplasma sp. AdecLV25b]
MKRILKMLTAINFTGLSVLPIIACGTPSSNPTATMNAIFKNTKFDTGLLYKLVYDINSKNK